MTSIVWSHKPLLGPYLLSRELEIFSKLVSCRSLLGTHNYRSSIPAMDESTKKRQSRKKNKKRQPPEEKTTLTLLITDPEEDIEDLFSDKEIKQIRVSLLEWYDENQRELPWRQRSGSESDGGEEEKRAYGVWVSEIMLQQTRVQTVIEYYNRWMKKWPTIHHLSQASLEEVNEMWAGLGYYRRARFLLEGAKMIVDGGGGFPNIVSALLKVPGIGNYTAGAIASIAFNEAVPVVDGNVIRVLARLKAISANPKDSLTVKNFWKLAAQLVDPCRPGDFNQSLMELGATVCTPLNPSCASCPVSGQCRALSISKHDSSVLVTDYPIKVEKTKQRHDISAACVVEILGGQDGSEINQHDSRFLLVKRPDEGLLAGLWEFPSVMLDEEVNLTRRRKETDCFLKKSFSLDSKKNCNIVSREDVGEFVHIFSHIRLKVYVELLVLRLKGGMNDWLEKQNKGTMAWKCVDNEALSNMGLTSGVRKVYTMVEKFKQKGSTTNSIPSRKRTSSKKLRYDCLWRIKIGGITIDFVLNNMAASLGGRAVGVSSFPSSSSYLGRHVKATTSSSSSSAFSLQMASKSATSRGCITCSAVQETSTSAADKQEVNTAEKAEEKEAPPAKPKPSAKAAKAPVKPLPQLMEEEVIPSLKATLETQKELSDIELSFQDNKLEGSFTKKSIGYSFWAFFPTGVLTGPKGFSLSSYGQGASTVEPFLVDEKKITARQIVFWVEKRLAAQGIIPVWKE
ncbi:hypothetical protein QYF36_025504 [Acer negundo]|nr:hypothetical protein QYF36_025504 [Acer negundo]